MAKARSQTRPASIAVAPLANDVNLSKLNPRRDLANCLGLALLVVLIYWPVAQNEFINYDDDVYIKSNERVNDGLTWNGLKWAATTVHAANWHPLTWISHMIDWQIFGSNAAGHHLMNVGFHILNTVLLYCLLLRATGAAWRCLMVAALFAAHPLHVESVAWAAERKDVLSTSLGLATIWVWLGFLQHRDWGRYLTAIILFAASLMAKPMLVTLPFLLMLLDYWPLQRAAITRLAAQVHEKLPLLLLSAASCVVTVIAQSRGGAVLTLIRLSVPARIATVMQSYCGYLQKMVWPVGLAVIYPLPKSVNWLAAMACGILLVGLTAFLLAAARKHKYFAVGWLWYLGTLVPVIGIVQVGSQAMADRYTYLSLIGIFVLVVWSLADLAAKSGNSLPPYTGRGRGVRARISPSGLKLLPALAAVALVVALSSIASRQVAYWANSRTLFEHALTVTTGNNIAHNNLATVLISQHRYDEAEWNIEQAIHIEPNYIDAYGSMAMLRAIQKKYAEAIAIYDRVLRLDPNCVKAYLQKANVCQDIADHAQAEACLREAVRLEPTNSTSFFGLGLQQQDQGKTQDAIDSYATSLRLRPKGVSAINNLAWIYAAHPKEAFRDGSKAVAIAEPASALPTCDSDLLDTLAAAYAEAGRFEDALRMSQRAIEKATQEKKPAQAVRDIEKRAALYAQHQPYRDPTLLGKR